MPTGTNLHSIISSQFYVPLLLRHALHVILPHIISPFIVADASTIVNKYFSMF